MAKSYSEKLKDPRWQKKRLEILERDKWSCQCCFDTKSTLHIHHVRYLRNLNPWDYDNDKLITLCGDCHKEENEQRKEYERMLLDVLKDRGFLSDSIYRLVSGFCGMGMPPHCQDVVASAIEYALRNKMDVIISDYFSSIKTEAKKNG